MTRKTNARIAGFTFLFYIAAGLTSLFLSGRAGGGASVARHAADLRLIVLLTLLTTLSAWVLGVTLYAITREQDPDLAMLGMICRVGEGMSGAAGVSSTAVTATFFAVGSTLFSWLLLRGRMIPQPLAWLGVVASILLVIGLPLQLGGLLGGRVAQFMWLPMLAFEVPLAFWLLIKGAATPASPS